ncbi:MAG TPA: DUF3696 domain-containing protein [Ktedonobacteraceae bacterium]
MIQRIHVQNFKCFGDLEIILKPLTIFTGLNGTGKSSVIQSMLLLRQSYQQGVLMEGKLALNGDLVHLGTGRDLFFEFAGSQREELLFELLCKDQAGKQRRASWCCAYTEASNVLAVSSPLSMVDEQIFHTGLFTEKFQYLQAERLGPRRFSDLNFFVKAHTHLGSQGEFTAHYLQEFGDKQLHLPLEKMAHPQATSNTLRAQVEAWLGEVSPGVRINLTPNPGTDTVSLQYSFEMGTQVSSNYRATNVGFGLTYTLPVIVALLSAAPGALILLENPEAHLHPRGQTTMGRLLARAISCGIQIVVETHSDHLLNGVRVAIHDGELSPDDAQIHFFCRKEDGFADVISPLIDRDGRIDRWPADFFDEMDKSLEALLEPRKE